MNSKNFNASQKHFEKKRVALSAEIKKLKESESKAWEQADHYRELCVKQEEELKNLREKLKVAMEYSKLSDNDLKKALESDKNICNFIGLMSAIKKGINGINGTD